MMKNFAINLNDRLESAKNELNINDVKNGEKIQEIDVSFISEWVFRDRQSFEYGNIDSLKKSIHEIGQQQPVILVKKSDDFISNDKNKNSQYILISGYRRYIACKQLNIKVLAIVRSMNFEEAVASVIAENMKEGVSDYSKGLFFKSVLDTDKITQKDFSKKIGFETSTFNNYMAFSQIPDEFWSKLEDKSKVSARTASEIRAIIKKSDLHYQAILSIYKDIENGAGEKKIKNLVNKKLNLSKIDNDEAGIKNSIAIHYGIHDVNLMKVDRKNITFFKEIYESENYEQLVNQIKELVKDFYERQKKDI